MKNCRGLKAIQTVILTFKQCRILVIKKVITVWDEDMLLRKSPKYQQNQLLENDFYMIKNYELEDWKSNAEITC